MLIGSPSLDHYSFWIMVAIEMVFFFEIIISFFLQDTNEDGRSKREPLLEVSANYIKNKLLFDMVTFIPLGGIGSYLINRKLRVFWCIKCARIKYLMFIFNPKLFHPYINWYIDYK